MSWFLEAVQTRTAAVYEPREAKVTATAGVSVGTPVPAITAQIVRRSIATQHALLSMVRCQEELPSLQSIVPVCLQDFLYCSSWHSCPNRHQEYDIVT